MDENLNEVEIILKKAFEFKEFKMFINRLNELIVIPKINAYFRLEDVKSELDFKCKILEWLSYYTAENHWNKYWSPKMIKFINYMLDTNFTKEKMQIIYCSLGNAVNHKLTIEFIKNNYDFSILKSNCENCWRRNTCWGLFF